MAEADLLEEIEELKDKIDSLNYEIENLKEEKDEIVSELTEKVEVIKQETEDDWRSRLKFQEKESNKQLEGLIHELDEIRSAFSGDTGGWEVKEDKNENIFYKNSITGERRDEIPQSLYIADLISRADEAETLKIKLNELEVKYKKNDLIKKEFELLNNKIKTEINSLRSIDRLWKESANAVYKNLSSVKLQFDSQIDQIVDGFGMFQKSSVRMGNVIQPMNKVRLQLAKLQKRISQQESEIAQLNSKVVVLQNDIDQKAKKITRLSEGLEEEVERLMKPMREKLAENMLVIMKEKVSRAQERRDLSDLWPSNVMMPTLLMRYRAITESERLQRLEVAKERQASLALAIEIRANVAESKMWEVKYDDYGRQIYEHSVTLETVDVEPEIMSYQPPPGRDVQGNILQTEQNNIDNWTLMSDYKGIVYYKNKYTDEISYTSPNAYSRIPRGKSTEELVADAAKLLLTHIKGKIEKHIIDQKFLKNKLLNPLTVEEKKKKEKDRLRAGLTAENEAENEEEEKLKEDLSLYRYDIETIEMLAMSFDEKKSIDTDPSGARVEIRKFMSDPEQVRNFDPEQLTGPTLIEVDFEEITVPQLREIVEKLATNEEKIEARLKRVRENLRDFSYILMEKAVEYDAVQTELQAQIIADKKKAKKQELKDLYKQAQKKARLKRKLEARYLKECADYYRDKGQNDGVDGGPSIEFPGSVMTGDITVLDDMSTLDGGPSQLVDGGPSVTFEDQPLLASVVKEVEKLDTELITPIVDSKVDPAIPTDPDAEKNEDDVDEEDDVNDDDDDDNVSEITGVDEIPADNDVVFLFGDPFIEDLPETKNSDLIVRITEKLSNLALFCGYHGLRLENIYEDSTNDISMKKNSIEMEKLDNKFEPSNQNYADDDWLTSSFFITVTKDKIDAIHQSNIKPYDPIFGLLSNGPWATEQAIQAAQGLQQQGRDIESPFIVGVQKSNENIKQFYALWKARQLMAEVLKYQVQQDALSEAIKYRIENCNGKRERTNGLLSIVRENTNDVVKSLPHLNCIVSVKNIYLDGTPVWRKLWSEGQQQYIVLSIGGWAFKTEGSPVTGHPLVWSKLSTNALMSKFKLMNELLIVEVFDKFGINRDTRIGYGSIKVSKLVTINVGNDMDFEIPLKDKRNGRAGIVRVTLCGNPCLNPDEFKEDPKELLKKEVNIVNMGYSKEVDIVTGERDDDIVLEKSIEDQDNDQSYKVDTINELSTLQDKSLDTLSLNTDQIIDFGDNNKNAPNLIIDNDLDNNNNIDSNVVDLNNIDDDELKEIIKNPKKKNSTKLKQETDLLSGIFPSLVDQQANFSTLVSDLRGDSDNFIKMMLGDITLQEVLKLGHRPSATNVRQLPNIQSASTFLLKKHEMFSFEQEQIRNDIQKFYEEIDDLMEETTKKYKQKYMDAASNQKSLTDIEDKNKGELEKVKSELNIYKVPLIPPKEPEFEEYDNLPYVPNLPTVGAINDRGKKKKKIEKKAFTELLEKIKAGECDAQPWDFGEYWPDKKQTETITEACSARRSVLDAGRKAEDKEREDKVEVWKGKMDQWELDERKRKIEFERLKKESRKANLKIECVQERILRFSTEHNSIETNSQILSEMNSVHTKAKERFKMLQVKQYLEENRMKKVIRKIKLRLMKAIDARSRALDLPAGSINDIEFDTLRGQAEEALRILKFEIVDCKQQCLDEGVRLRSMYEDIHGCCKGELNRVQVYREILSQRNCIDKIIDRNRFEHLHLLVDMEKLRLLEAEKDEKGLRNTVDNLGECYIRGTLFESVEINSCNRLLNLAMAKVNLSEGVQKASSNTTKCLMDTIGTKYRVEFTPVRDSWLENSDYDRATRLTNDCLSWLQMQRYKLQLKEKNEAKESSELRLQLQAAEDQNEISMAAQATETSCVTESATKIAGLIQIQYENLRNSTSEALYTLERNITSLSREGQDLREQILSMNVENRDKTKILWAFINTLQRTVQQMSARLEMALEERDRVVIKSKLDSDKTRHELRIERKHCSNLLFIIHAQRGTMKQLQDVLVSFKAEQAVMNGAQQAEKFELRRQQWEHVFCFTRLSTDVDALFEFFAARLANLAGSRKSFNDSFASNGAAVVLGAMCKSPRAIIRKYAARALGGMGWDSFVETRILIWDSFMYWKIYKASVIAKEKSIFEKGLEKFTEDGQFDALLNIDGRVDEFVPSGNMSLRTIIKQRRQWALRAARRVEGPNTNNQKLINIKDGVIPNLLHLSIQDGGADWEIARNAALAICIASYELQNHKDMTNDPMCVQMIIIMCTKNDEEVQTHAAVTIANLCHRDEGSQAIFGKSNAIPALLDMCKSSIVDLLEAATAALANITCYYDPNCKRVMEADGVLTMVTLVTKTYSENLLDIDQNDEVQANACEMLANVSRYNSELTTVYFNGDVIDSIVLMCASENIQVKRHAPLVLGNIGQSEHCRVEIGDRGGIEALFLLLEDHDNTVQANTIWALCNLMWHPPNQERAGRFMVEIVDFLQSSYTPVATYSSILLANTLYYNNPNRVRFLEIEGAMEMLMKFIRENAGESTILEGYLRSVLSLSYLDYVALWLGTDAKFIPFFIGLLVPPFISHDIMRFSLEILCNLCVHHINRRTILDNKGIDAIVTLHSDSDKYIQELSVKIIEHLEDITPIEVLTKLKVSMGLEQLVTLASNSDPLVRAVAAESLGEDIWHDPSKQNRVTQVGGVDALLAITSNDDEPVESILPALWSLRNLLHNNSEAQSQFNFRDGIGAVVTVIGRCISGFYYEQTEKILEASLSCFVTAIINHERNSRRLLVIGLEVIMDIADEKIGETAALNEYVYKASKSEGVIALSKSLLLMLGPYNYVVCKNCFKKQDLHGQSCVHCGYRLLVEVVDRNLGKIRQK